MVVRILRFSLGLLLALSVSFAQAQAQDGADGGPIYIVQAGDTLFDIALRFGVTVDEIVGANGFSDPNTVGVGAQVIIPGLDGVTGVLTTEDVPFGETLRSLSRRNRIPLPGLARLNRVVSPAELFVGSQVILPLNPALPELEDRASLQPGRSLLELAVEQDANPWTLTNLNGLESTLVVIPGDVLFTPSPSASGPGALPESVRAVAFADLPLIQGETTTILIESDQELELEGHFTVEDLRSGNSIQSSTHFFRASEGRYAGLNGVHAMALPGFYPYELVINHADGSQARFSQLIYVGAGGYVFDPSLNVPPETLDPANTGPEDELWNELGRRVTPEKMWTGLFQSPAFDPTWRTSVFGSRRSYNNGPYNFFHTGLDFGGGVGLEVNAPADGVVTFAGPLVVRGISIMIDHGWGVSTGYMHLSGTLVEEGDRVLTGQVIGLVGGTGRVTGAHLHWEVWVGGFQVNPATWLEISFPQGFESPDNSPS